jgi:acyl-CoA thioester hydrolase
MKTHIYKTRVRYAETDQMGVVYYANYLVYLESGRTGLLRDEGVAHSDMEAKGIFLPVIECHINYKGAAKYDEEISVETWMAYVKHASIKINYKITNQTGDVIVTAYTVHPFIDKDWKIVTIPGNVREVLSKYTE